MALLVVGNVCVDDTFFVDRLPRPGETVNALATARGVGGKGANQAMAAARTGAEVLLFAALGADSEAVFVRSVLTSDLSLHGLVVGDSPTDRSTIMVDDAGENVIVTAAASAAAFDPLAGGALQSRLRSGDHLLMQGNLDAEVTKACLEVAHDKGAVTILNPSPLGRGSSLRAADIVIVNRGEAETLSGCSDPAVAAWRLRNEDGKSVIVTLGANGALCLEHGATGPTYVAAPPVAAVDSSGAGDVFAGVLAGCLTRGLSLVPAVTIGVQAASIAVTRRGTLAACPSRSELATLLSATSRDLS